MDADIRHDQNFFQFFIEIFINGRKSTENIVKHRGNIISGFCKPLNQTAEKPLFLFRHLSSSYFVSSFSIRFTDTKADTPFSCMVTP